MNASALVGMMALTFAKCDPTNLRQQWCISQQDQIRDTWGRCLTRSTCEAGSAKGVPVYMDTCGSLTSSCGGQNWVFDKDSSVVTVQIHAKSQVRRSPPRRHCHPPAHAEAIVCFYLSRKGCRAAPSVSGTRKTFVNA